MSNLPNIITQSFTQVNDENNNQQEDVQVWPDLQTCDPDVAVGLLNRHVAKLERDGKLQKCNDDKKPEPIKYPSSIVRPTIRSSRSDSFFVLRRRMRVP